MPNSLSISFFLFLLALCMLRGGPVGLSRVADMAMLSVPHIEEDHRMADDLEAALQVIDKIADFAN